MEVEVTAHSKVAKVATAKVDITKVSILHNTYYNIVAYTIYAYFQVDTEAATVAIE